MNITEYVKEHGNESFLEKDFNDIDAIVMGILSYIDFTDIVSEEREYVTLEDAISYFLNEYDLKKFLKISLFNKDVVAFCKVVVDAPRYKKLLLSNYVNSVTYNEQFSALAIKLPNKKTVISFEGTDNSLVGWEDDFQFSYEYPTVVEKDAINYFNKTIGLFSKGVILVGHSKGGHLALATAFSGNLLKRSKIKKIYNLDGPGLREELFNTKRYQKMSKKIETIVPNYSLFGLIMGHEEKRIVVKSTRKDVMAHSLFTWIIEDGMLKETELSFLSKKLEVSINAWLDKHTDDERKRFVEDIFDFLNSADISTTVEILNVKSFIALFKSKYKLDKETKDMLSDLLIFNVSHIFK